MLSNLAKRTLLKSQRYYGTIAQPRPAVQHIAQTVTNPIQHAYDIPIGFTNYGQQNSKYWNNKNVDPMYLHNKVPMIRTLNTFMTNVSPLSIKLNVLVAPEGSGKTTNIKFVMKKLENEQNLGNVLYVDFSDQKNSNRNYYDSFLETSVEKSYVHSSIPRLVILDNIEDKNTSSIKDLLDLVAILNRDSYVNHKKRYDVLVSASTPKLTKLLKDNFSVSVMGKYCPNDRLCDLKFNKSNFISLLKKMENISNGLLDNELTWKLIELCGNTGQPQMLKTWYNAILDNRKMDNAILKCVIDDIAEISLEFEDEWDRLENLVRD
jgi:hypothetical protein